MVDDPGNGDAEQQRLLARARRVRKALRAPAGRVDLARIDPRGTPGLPSKLPSDAKAWSQQAVTSLGTMLAARQERLFAGAQAGGDRRRVLLVLQAMDCGGKDGTVKSLVGSMNPLGARITAFSAPTPAELSQHFLWRISRALPPAGYVGVFNRSHYEDVLVVRVRELVPPRVWKHRYDEINAFEAGLAADGLTIVKVMLHISPDEQRKRLLARLDDPSKTWKFQPSDIDDRALWPAYQRAYMEALSRCATPQSPWYVVPADRKWYRNWAVANILLAHLAELDLAFPATEIDVAAQRARLAGGPAGEQQVNNE